MRHPVGNIWRSGILLLCGLLPVGSASHAQQSDPGRSIGKVSTAGHLIVIELDDGALGRANLFDLTGRTLRFKPDGLLYRIETAPLHWDSNYGPELAGAEAKLHNFAFPFSGKLWRSFLVGTTGSLRFGASESDVTVDPYGHRDGGIVLDRFDQLSGVAGRLADKAAAICVFLKPRMSGPHYVKESPDRVVITWDLTEPFGSLLDFGWFKSENRFQAVLHQDGSIEMSYQAVAAKDAIVGIYPVFPGSQQRAAAHFSSLSHRDGPFGVVYEAFHYLAVPRPQDLSCTVIKALGDRFDFLAYYSDFRIDAQEASSPSDGPIAGNVTGIGDTQHDQTPQILESRCTQGRFQLGFAQPVFVGSNEAQEKSPGGAPVSSSHDLTFFSDQLAEGSLNYNYAVGHLGHEVGHRWSAYVSAKVGGQRISLGTWPHWAPGLQTRVAFPYSLPAEASTEGGGAWQDNSDGTYTQLREGWFVPATGYSYLDLYLMGLISAAEVPDFFILRNLVRVGIDVNGHAVFRAERTRVTVQDIIAAEGPRAPDVDHSQRKFNTGIVVIVEHGQKPSRELLEQANGIRQQWIKYWDTTTGHRASMTTSPR